MSQSEENKLVHSNAIRAKRIVDLLVKTRRLPHQSKSRLRVILRSLIRGQVVEPVYDRYIALVEREMSQF